MESMIKMERNIRFADIICAWADKGHLYKEREREAR